MLNGYGGVMVSRILKISVVLFILITGVLTIVVAASNASMIIGYIITFMAVSHLYFLYKEIRAEKQKQLDDFEAILSSKLLAKIRSEGIADVYIERHRWDIKLCHTSHMDVIDTFLDRSRHFRHYEDRFLISDLAGFDRYIRLVGIDVKLENMMPYSAVLHYERLRNND